MKKLLIVFLAGFLSLFLIYPAFAARTSFGLPGIYNLNPFTLGDAEGSALSTDNHGQLIISPSSSISIVSSTINTIPSIPVASTTLTFIFDNATSTENIKATAGDLTGMFFDNNSMNKLYILFVNTATAPVSGATPLLTYAINPNNQFIVDASTFNYLQKYFSSGIGLCLSTTFKTCTPSTDNANANIEVEYK